MLLLNTDMLCTGLFSGCKSGCNLMSLFVRVSVVVVSLCLKRFVSIWVHWSLGRVQNGVKMYQLPRHECNRY